MPKKPRSRAKAIKMQNASPPVQAVDRVRQESLMRVALDLARRGVGRTTPNPAVGAVIVKDGQIIAGGFTSPAGGDHAEVAALRKLDFAAASCELYTTLEPCDHLGRTGPCTEAILRSGIRSVVIGALD